MTETFDYWYPWHPARYKAKTMHLTPEQDGIYRRLIDHYMETKAPLPASHVALARIVGCATEKIEQNASSILEAFFTHKDGMLYHRTCNEILDQQDALARRRSRIASGAAKKRWQAPIENKQENASSMHDAMLHDATGQDRTGQNRKGKEEREGGDDDIDQAVAMYNIAAERSGLPLVQKLSDTRKKHLRARLKDAGGIEGWAAALNKLEQSAFCRGDNDRGWKADFDFIVRESSFIKLMEGKYDGKPSTNADRNREALHQWANEPMDG